MIAVSENYVKENSISEYLGCFNKVVETNGDTKYQCLAEKCCSVLSEKSSAIRHLKLQHKKIYNAIKNLKDSKGSEKAEELELRVKVKLKDIWDGCLELVTRKGLPLSFVDSDGFKKIIKPYSIALKNQGINFVINSSNLQKYISENAEKVKHLIAKETKKKLISLMIDIASRHNRSVLGIAFFLDGQLVIRTIGMHALHASHTAKYVASIIKKKLAEYDIALNQIISITSDNAKNMLRTAIELDEAAQVETNCNAPEVSQLAQSYESIYFDEDADSDDEEETSLDSESEADSSESDTNVDDDIFDEDYYNAFLANVRREFNFIPHTELVCGMSCAVHCVHLIVTKALKQSRIERTLLKKIRKLAKKLRTPSYRNLLKSQLPNALPIPTLDVETRWNSIYLMLKKLTKLRVFCDSLKQNSNHKKIQKFLLADAEWKDMEEIMKVLRPFARQTARLQSPNITLSDFYGFFLVLQIRTRKHNNSDLAKNLLKEMDGRKAVLLENKSMLAAVFLDPRYKIALQTDRMRNDAIERLIDIHDRLRTVENPVDVNSSRENAVVNQMNNNTDTEEESSFDEIQAELMNIPPIQTSSSCSNHQNTRTLSIEQQLREFFELPSHNIESITNFWEENKEKMPDLYKISNVIFGIPPTQVTVERAFSALALILSHLRTRLSDTNLENILLIRLNFSVFKEI